MRLASVDDEDRPLPASVVQKIALAMVVDQAHNSTFSQLEATPARTHGDAAVWVP
jgi:hypothetical protein